MDSRGRRGEAPAERERRTEACGRGRGARLSRTGNKAAASDCLALRRSAARGHVTAAAHQPLRAAARELEIGWDIPPAGRPLGSAWRRGHELGGAAVHGFFSLPHLVRVPGASVSVSASGSPGAWSPPRLLWNKGILHLEAEKLFVSEACACKVPTTVVEMNG